MYSWELLFTLLSGRDRTAEGTSKGSYRKVKSDSSAETLRCEFFPVWSQWQLLGICWRLKCSPRLTLSWVWVHMRASEGDDEVAWVAVGEMLLRFLKKWFYIFQECCILGKKNTLPAERSRLVFFQRTQSDAPLYAPHITFTLAFIIAQISTLKSFRSLSSLQ